MSEDTILDKPTDKTADTRAFEKPKNHTPTNPMGAKHPGDAASTPQAALYKTQANGGRNTEGQEREKTRLLNSPLQLSERQEMIRIVSNRLFVALFALLSVTMIGGYLTWSGHELSAGATNWMVLLCGAIGGFISLQRRLKIMIQDDLLLLARSWVFVLLSPLVGGILALLLYFLFIAGLLQGDLFPNFDVSKALDPKTGLALSTKMDTTSQSGLSILFQVQGEGYKDYAKLVFWCFLAGYSESFVTNIISHFESASDQSDASKL